MNKVRVCKSLIIPRYEVVQSDTDADQTYTVIPSTIWNDAICTCPGFRFRQECKHIKRIPQCTWAAAFHNYPNPIPCPSCGGATTWFDLDPELE